MRQHLPPLAGNAQSLTRSVCQQERHALRPFIGPLPVAGPSSPANLPRRPLFFYSIFYSIKRGTW